MLHFTEVCPCNARSSEIIPDMRIKFKYLERPIKCVSDYCKEKLKLVITYIIRETICPYNTRFYSV